MIGFGFSRDSENCVWLGLVKFADQAEGWGWDFDNFVIHATEHRRQTQLIQKLGFRNLDLNRLLK